jgi:hypothetical protein
MPRKTKIIFITVFIIVGAIMLGVYFYNSKKSTTTNTGDTSFYQKFNPFGTSTKVDNGGDSTPDTNIVNQGGETSKETSRLHKLTDFAIAGAVFFEDTRDEKVVPSLRYVERATGHVYQMYLDTKVTGKISNSTIPSVYEAIFDGKASSIIYRYLSSDNQSITSFLATLGGKTSSFLSSDILNISLSPNKNKFFSIIENKNGVIGTVKSFDETKTNQIFTSAFSEWLPQWVTEQNIYLTTKPSYLVDGVVFVLNTTNGTLSKIFGGVKGLTTLANSDGTLILYGASLETGPKLNIFDIKNHTSVDLDKYGLPEKCIWSNDKINVYCAVPNTVVGTQYPDSWYQGLTSFEDFFIKINTQTKEASTLANSVNETPVDAINLILNKNEDTLFFTNKKDYTLWQLDL